MRGKGEEEEEWESSLMLPRTSELGRKEEGGDWREEEEEEREGRSATSSMSTSAQDEGGEVEGAAEDIFQRWQDEQKHPDTFKHLSFLFGNAVAAGGGALSLPAAQASSFQIQWKCRTGNSSVLIFTEGRGGCPQSWGAGEVH